MQTEKLYWHDAHLTDFSARVIAVKQADETLLVALDQSAFYPEGGGQPSDRGSLNDSVVEFVSLADDGIIWHHLTDAAKFLPGEEVRGAVVPARRREMLQQHTGQHILSQAFLQLYGAETRGFRITERGAEIDLTLDLPQDEIATALTQAETLANSVVFDNRAVRTHVLSPEEAARLPLRKESFITDCVRVVEIADFDYSPCGGTHAKQTGEVGLIAIRSHERAKQMTRVHFVCGMRALHDFRSASQTVESIARRFSVGRDETPDAVNRLLDENKALLRRTRELAAMAIKAEARELSENIPLVHGLRIVTRIFAERDLDEIKLLAHRLVELEGTIALLASHERENARLVFARSAELTADMNALLRSACEKLGGRGGGKPDFAQGGGSNVTMLAQVLSECAATLTENG